MLSAAEESAIGVYDSLIMGAVGNGYCRMVEGRAAITVLPSGISGIGLALAFDQPVAVEACVERGLVMDYFAEVRVWGPGLTYSSRPLQSLLEKLAQLAVTVAENRILLKDVIGLDTLHPELLVASVYGTSILVGNEILKPRTHGLWLVAVKASNSISVKPECLSGIEVAELLTTVSDLPELLNRHYTMLKGSHCLKDGLELSRILARYAAGFTVDPFGEYYVALVDEYGLLMDLATVLSFRGFKYSYGRLTA